MPSGAKRWCTTSINFCGKRLTNLSPPSSMISPANVHAWAAWVITCDFPIISPRCPMIFPMKASIAAGFPHQAALRGSGRPSGVLAAGLVSTGTTRFSSKVAQFQRFQGGRVEPMGFQVVFRSYEMVHGKHRGKIAGVSMSIQ